MKIIMKRLEDLTPYENNPRINDGAVDATAKSIAEFGFKVPMVITADGVIIAGHTRKKAAEKLGLKEVPCIIANDLTEEQIRAFRLADNKTAELAEWDPEKLAEELSKIENIEMALFGFEEAEEEDTAEAYEDDYIEPANLPTKVQPGERWSLGDHILVCGDSTDPDVVKSAIQGGYSADLLVTDPPYNVDYTNKSLWLMNSGLDRTSEKMKKIRAKQTIQNDKRTDEEFEEFLSAALTAARESMKQGAAFYVFHADTKGMQTRAATAKSLGEIRQVLVWYKNHMVFGRQDYQWIHEPCLYGWTDGASHYFINDHKQRTVKGGGLPDLEHMTKAEMKELLQEIYKEEKTIIEEDRPPANDLHPTMKPIPLIARLIKNSSRPGEIVLDTFGGSGTTLMACEQLGRRCAMVELDPHYCDVIIDRWEKFTGREAQLISE